MNGASTKPSTTVRIGDRVTAFAGGRDRVLEVAQIIDKRVGAAIASSDQVQQEDIGICESVQKGLASGGYIPGRYSVFRQAAERAFQVRLARQLAGEMAGDFAG